MNPGMTNSAKPIGAEETADPLLGALGKVAEAVNKLF